VPGGGRLAPRAKYDANSLLDLPFITREEEFRRVSSKIQLFQLLLSTVHTVEVLIDLTT
jgi:hypothetical protein